MPSNTLPDLVTRAQKGSADAAGQLYERHYRSIFRYLFYRTGDQQAAEDLTGEVFLKMVQALPAYRVTSATFRTWLFQIARNLSIDHFRRSQTHPVVTLEEYIPAGEKAPESAGRSTPDRRPAPGGIGPAQCRAARRGGDAFRRGNANW